MSSSNTEHFATFDNSQMNFVERRRVVKFLWCNIRDHRSLINVFKSFPMSDTKMFVLICCLKPWCIGLCFRFTWAINKVVSTRQLDPSRQISFYDSFPLLFRGASRATEICNNLWLRSKLVRDRVIRLSIIIN